MQKAHVIPFERSALDIHNEAMLIAKNIKTEYLRLFEILIAVETRKIYYDFEITSLQAYCIELLELSRFVANDFINVVRKSLDVPSLAASIRSGKLTISKARKICSVINETNAQEWIALAETCSARVIEKTVAMAKPREAVPESQQYVSEGIIDIRMAISEEFSDLLTKTKDFFSQKMRRAVSSEEALFILMRENLQRHDPVEKAKRAQARARKNATSKTSPARESIVKSMNLQTKPSSRYRPAAVEHAVDLRDGNRCVHVDKNGKRCEVRRWLNKHHIIGFADGGAHAPENLETLCWAHHKIRHMNEVVT